MPSNHTIIVPRISARAVAEHYGLNARKLRRWLNRNQNARLLGTLDSPAMRSTVARFERCAHLTDWQVVDLHFRLPGDTHLDNEYRGRGLAR